MTRQMSKTTVKKPARIIRQNAQIRAQPDFRPWGPGAPAGRCPLPAFQAERMTGRVRVDPEPWLGAGQPGSPQREHLRLRGSDVVNVDVQVDLLGKRRVRPARRLVAGRVLEAQAGLAVADVDPVAVDPGDRPAIGAPTRSTRVLPSSRECHNRLLDAPFRVFSATRAGDSRRNSPTAAGIPSRAPALAGTPSRAPARAGIPSRAPAWAGISSRQRTVAAICAPGAAGSGSAPWTYLP